VRTSRLRILSLNRRSTVAVGGFRRDPVDRTQSDASVFQPGASLDHHQVWLSTVSRMGDEYGVTIFAGRAYAVDSESLKLEGVVRLADERRRRAVRVTGSMVTLPPAGGPSVRVATLDISRGAVRLPIGEGGWTYDDPLDLVVHLGDEQSINVLGRLLRIDAATQSVVLGFDYLPDYDAEALDRFALTQLSEYNWGAPAPESDD